MTTTLLPVNSILNPRDLGGIVGLNGRKIKTHRLIRTGTLTRMSDEDIQFLKNYGLTTIIDLRSKSERKDHPDPQIEGVKNISLPLSEEEGTLGGIQDLSREDDLYHHDPHSAFKMMCDHYSDHVVKAHDQNTIRQDYLASNSILSAYRAERDKKFENTGENLTFRSNMRILSSASDSFFDTILLTIEEQYHNMDAYLKNVLDVTPELRDRLRELYLEER